MSISELVATLFSSTISQAIGDSIGAMGANESASHLECEMRKRLSNRGCVRSRIQASPVEGHSLMIFYSPTTQFSLTISRSTKVVGAEESIHHGWKTTFVIYVAPNIAAQGVAGDAVLDERRCLLLFFLSSSFSSSFSSLVRPCISLLECPVSGAVAAKDGALELLLLEAMKTVVTMVVTLVYCFPWSSLCASSAQDINDGDEDVRCC
ncbi:hypothetical protein NC653_029243 [Populus alba x Populus x berolinensis]|uniref:Uncharacterized protein n=1 Tax=Populus alba x Populus x berolinensis TaxID=444605 RepID=A0AAD6Q472_9ROSI|nr:hypothetical protein NC653_029243 [Populus alba x Populus x berolinensis]